MDSINRNQTEENQQDLNGADAIAKIKELVEKAPTCFFLHLGRDPAIPSGARPMSVQKVDDAGKSLVPERGRQPQERRSSRSIPP